MTIEEAKAKIFQWLCSPYHDPGKGNEYIDKDILKNAISIPEVFAKAVNEFADPGAHDCVEVEATTGRLRLGIGGLILRGWDESVYVDFKLKRADLALPRVTFQ